jgi:Domain of unknown function (DUF1905)
MRRSSARDNRGLFFTSRKLRSAKVRLFVSQTAEVPEGAVTIVGNNCRVALCMCERRCFFPQHSRRACSPRGRTTSHALRGSRYASANHYRSVGTQLLFMKQMTKAASKIRFKAKLVRPAESQKGEFWTFLILPRNVSAKLPSRGMTAIEGTINGLPFQGVLEPDGQKSHWLKVNRKLSKAAGAEPGDAVTLEIAPATEEPEPAIPSDLKKALTVATPKTRALWSDN